MSQSPLFFVIIIACFAVAIVLMMGLGGFAKGSGWAQKNANKLMRYRLAAQFIAVLLIVAFILIRRQTGS